MQAISNRILIGDVNSPSFVFENDAIDSVSEETAVSLIGDELFIDQLVPIVKFAVYIRYIFKPTNYDGFKSSDGYLLCSHWTEDIRKLPYGTKVTYYSNNAIAGVYYIKNVERVGKSKYKLNCISAVGLMSKQQHKGGIYTGQTFSAVAAEILGTDYTYEIDNNVASQKVYGWLPYSTRRQNLYQLVMAYGVQIIKSASGNMRFTFLTAEGTPPTIPKSRLFHGGSVTYQEPASRVEVIEHGYHYMSSVEEETLLDNPSDYVDHIVVRFDHPIYADSIHASEESADSLTIHERGTNYAIVSGVGVLLGKPYIHSTKLISLDNPEDVNEKNVTVENATLVTLVNGDNVLERLGQYYFNAMNTQQDIIVDGEKSGGRYQMWNPYQESMIGFITKMSTRSTSIRRAQCEVIENYTPVGAGVAYTQREQIDLEEGDSNYWQIPSGVKRVRVVLIAYGEDGERGENGEDGEYAEGATPPKGGKGGKGGRHGDGGKVFAQTIYTEGLDHLGFHCVDHYTYCDYGDQTITSADGASSPTGYYDEMSGDLFALPGFDGIDGGAGGTGGIWKTRMIDATEVLDPSAGSVDGTVFMPIPLSWVQGAISSSTGRNATNNTRVRNDDFYALTDGARGFGFKAPDGYKVYAFGYSQASATASGSYQGAISSGFVEGAQVFTNLSTSIKFVRLVCAKTDDSAITPSEAPNIHFGLYLPSSSAYGSSYAAVNAESAGGISTDVLDNASADDADDQLEWRAAEPGEDVIDHYGVVHTGGAGTSDERPYYGYITVTPYGGGEPIIMGMSWNHGSFCNPLEMNLSDGGVWAFCGHGGGGGASAEFNGYSGKGKILNKLPSTDRRAQWPLPFPGFGTPDHMGDIDNGGHGASALNAPVADSRPGCGGNGGDGGGGGGGAGVSTWYNRTYNEVIFYGQGMFSMTGGKGGSGGMGGAGSDGQHGCVIIYY